jgi:hypothetical protein
MCSLSITMKTSTVSYLRNIKVSLSRCGDARCPWRGCSTPFIFRSLWMQYASAIASDPKLLRKISFVENQNHKLEKHHDRNH